MMAEDSESAIDNYATTDKEKDAISDIKEESITSPYTEAFPLAELEELQQETDIDQAQRVSNIERRTPQVEPEEVNQQPQVEDTVEQKLPAEDVKDTVEQKLPAEDVKDTVKQKLPADDNLPTAESEEVPQQPNPQKEPGIELKDDTPAEDLQFQGSGEFQADDTDFFGMQALDDILSQGVQVFPGEETTQQQGEEQNSVPVEAEAKMKSTKLPMRESCRIRLAEFVYKAAAPVVQDPTVPLYLRSCGAYIPGTAVRGAHGGSNRQDAETMRHELAEHRRACRSKQDINPTCTVPMRPKRFAYKSRMKRMQSNEEWRIWEDRDKDWRDHQLAVELGYETLVGNLLYINIPGGKDINRSWQNFLSGDLMEWGFPYEKGSMERPRMKQPEPYLAHQVKEKLWKFPRARTFQTTQEE